MKWILKEIEPGDIVRIPMSEVYHYGVCTGEDRIVQFGEPVLGIARPSSEIRVIAVDIKTFLGGAFAEVGELDKKEKKRRRKTEEIIAYAESSIGKGGYDILYNNCEHFANECLFGTAKSTCVDNVRSEIERKLATITIHIGATDEFSANKVLPAYAKKKLSSITNTRVRDEKRASYGLLQFSLKASDKRYDIKKCTLSDTGKPVHRDFFFSISHSDGVCAVATSTAPVGIDVESVRSHEADDKLCERILHPDESGDNLLALWTKKEAIFKLRGTEEIFLPSEINTTASRTKTYTFNFLGKKYILSVAADILLNIRIFSAPDNKILETEML